MGEEIHKDYKFFIELICVTIFSIVAAQMWNRTILEFTERHWKGNLFAYALMSILLSVISIAFLAILFAKK